VAEFADENLKGSRFERSDLGGSTFRDCDLSGARFREINMAGVVMRGVELINVDIDGWVENVTVNGVDLGPLVEAELDRRNPDRAKMRPEDPAGFRAAWDILERLWDQTVDRARRLPPELLHESVDGEWSFTETLRHLAMATDAWVVRAVLGDPSPWDPLDLPCDGIPDKPGVPHDRTARPDLGTVLALRRSRQAVVRQVIGALTEESLAADTEPVPGDSWPPPVSYPVRRCLRTVLNEEWEHRLFAERDLAALEQQLKS
jgi:uncharacterized damage-inducible protein DinB